MFRFVSAVFAAILMVMAGLSTAHAQDKQSLAEARKVIELTRVADSIQRILPEVSRVVGDTIVQANPDQDAKVRRAMDELFLPELSARLPAFMDEIAILYTTHFTLKELRQLNAFYASPVGKKSVNAMPQIAQQSMQIGSVWGQRTAQDVLQKLAPQLRQRGIKNL